MKARVKDVPVPGGRVIAVSDVHGNEAYLRGVLKKARFDSKDTLVIVGDLLEKGPESLKTLRSVMRIARENTVYWVQGNCDPVTDEFIPENDEGIAYWIRMSRWRLMRDMMEEAGLDIDALKDMDAFRHTLRSRFPAEFAFMEGLPHILTMGRYLFVHGGITDEPLEEQDAWQIMKNDAYLLKGYGFERWVVVGHWPTQLYDRKGQAGTPLVEWERHIVSIDGGCVIKDAGQLNAMIIPDANADVFEFVSYDELETFVAAQDQEECAPTLSVLYVDSAVEIVERAKIMSTLRLKSSGRVLRAPTRMIYERADGWHLDDYTDYVLPVRAGDVLKRVYTFPDGIYAKDAQGRVGWYRGRVKESCYEML